MSQRLIDEFSLRRLVIGRPRSWYDPAIDNLARLIREVLLLLWFVKVLDKLLCTLRHANKRSVLNHSLERFGFGKHGIKAVT